MISSQKKDLNFDLNLIPIIDILSCCICFLLMTVVWIKLGALNVQQGYGSQKAIAEKTSPLVVEFKSNGEINFSLQGQKPVTMTVHQAAVSLSQFISAVKKSVPALREAIVKPIAQSDYQDVIHIIDNLKASHFNVGVAPY